MLSDVVIVFGELSLHAFDESLELDVFELVVERAVEFFEH